MKQIILLFLLLVGVMVFAAWLSQPGADLAKFFTAQKTEVVKEQKPIVKIGDRVQIEVEIVKTMEERKTGLTKYETLSENQGMLFTFEEKDVKPVFWMKDMKFPIDIIWLDDGKIIEITGNVPVARAGLADNKIPRYQPAQTIDYVLEIAAGEAAKKGIKVQDMVELPQL